MPERHAKLLEIDLGQLRQDIGVDFIRAKDRLVLSEAETSEPTPDIHGRTAPAPNGSFDLRQRPPQRIFADHFAHAEKGGLTASQRNAVTCA